MHLPEVPLGFVLRQVVLLDVRTAFLHKIDCADGVDTLERLLLAVCLQVSLLVGHFVEVVHRYHIKDLYVGFILQASEHRFCVEKRAIFLLVPLKFGLQGELVVFLHMVDIAIIGGHLLRRVGLRTQQAHVILVDLLVLGQLRQDVDAELTEG